MIAADLHKVQVWVATTPVDMRKSFDGLGLQLAVVVPSPGIEPLHRPLVPLGPAQLVGLSLKQTVERLLDRLPHHLATCERIFSSSTLITPSKFAPLADPATLSIGQSFRAGRVRVVTNFYQFQGCPFCFCATITTLSTPGTARASQHKLP